MGPGRRTAMRGHADVLDAHGVDAKDPLVSV